MRDLKGKKALITGAASGIGRAIALRLASEGVQLMLVDVDDVALAETVNEAKSHDVQVIGRHCDVSSPSQISLCVKTVREDWGSLDILINNAGICYHGPTVKMSAEQWDRQLAINLHSPIQFTRELLPGLLELPEAHVVNIASIYGLVASARSCAYHTTKFGLVGFSEALRLEYSRQGLGVSCICPGFVSTGFFEASESHQERVRRSPPDWICTTPEAVANKVVKAIRRDRGLVVITPLAHLMHWTKRAAPWFIDWVHRIGRRGKMKRKAARLERKAA
ncbi:MAG: short-chain dehydrogenase [Planctomycetaceae bacterium]|nr:short-chain dehydrogenase [Planctomycetaceae bacterium]